MSDQEQPQAEHPDHRQYTLSITEEDRQSSFELEDSRWALKYQIRDWLVLGLMVLATLIWTGLVYLLEPGLR